jgi:hypothetical protein
VAPRTTGTAGCGRSTENDRNRPADRRIETQMTAEHATSGSSTDPTPLDRIARWGSLVLHIGIGVFPLSASGLMAPPWALAVIAVGWLVGLAVTWRLGKTRPGLALLVPVLTVAAWFGLMSAGDVWFGWVA